MTVDDVKKQRVDFVFVGVPIARKCGSFRARAVKRRNETARQFFIVFVGYVFLCMVVCVYVCVNECVPFLCRCFFQYVEKLCCVKFSYSTRWLKITLSAGEKRKRNETYRCVTNQQNLKTSASCSIRMKTLKKQRS